MRVFLIILDGVGIGAAPDCLNFNDPPIVNTVYNSLKKCYQEGYKLSFPNLSRLGFNKTINLKNPSISFEELRELGFYVDYEDESYGVMNERSLGKDTITGHWEIAGIITTQGFDTYPAFPDDLINEFSKRIGRGVLANKAASGTEIIKEYGLEHLKTGKVIVYTSSDSVFQVACHIDVVSLEELYQICEVAFSLIKEKNYRIARVIARPFSGEIGNFYRLNDKRKDFSVPPPSKTILDVLFENNLEVISVGKVSDIFADRSFTRKYKISGNKNIFQKVVELSKENFEGLVFANLVDFDTLYGHRQDYKGWVKAFEELDIMINDLVLKKDDVLIITADHGNDPTDESTDHTRESVPLIIKGNFQKRSLGVKDSFRYISYLIQLFFIDKLKTNLNIEEFQEEIIWKKV